MSSKNFQADTSFINFDSSESTCGYYFLPSKRKKRDKRKMFTNVSSSSLKSWGGVELFAYLSVQILYNLLLINFFFNNFWNYLGEKSDAKYLIYLGLFLGVVDFFVSSVDLFWFFGCLKNGDAVCYFSQRWNSLRIIGTIMRISSNIPGCCISKPLYVLSLSLLVTYSGKTFPILSTSWSPGPSWRSCVFHCCRSVWPDILKI